MTYEEIKKRIEYIAMVSGGSSIVIAELLAEYKKLQDDNARLKAQVETAKEIVQAGVQLMPIRKLAQWSGVRSFLEQDTDEYEGGAS